MIIKKETQLTSNQSGGDQRKQRTNNILIGFIGTNRTGKSTIAKKYAENWVKNNPDGFVLSYDPQDNFAEISDDHLYVKDPETPEKINQLAQYANVGSLVILDDYRLINRRPVEEDWLVQLMNFRAKWNVDIIYITHNPRLVLNYLTYFTSHYFIFYTKSVEGSFESKIPDYELCDTASSIVNWYVKRNGRGEYPKFHYCIVDTENEKIVPVNMEEEKNTIIDYLKELNSVKDKEKKLK